MHIYAGLMVWRDMSARHGQCLADLQLLCQERGIGFTNGTIYGDALVSRAQSIAASMFLRSDADVMWTCGSDTLFDPDDVIAMCQKACDGHDIIGAVVMKRAENPSIACPLPPGEWITLDGDSAPVETSIMGTGFSATHRRVFEKLVDSMPLCHQDHAEPWWPFYMPMVVEDDKAGNLYLSEDWALAYRAKAAGFRCWIDPSVRVAHLSTTALTLEDLLRPGRAEPMPMRLREREDGRIEVAVPEGMMV